MSVPSTRSPKGTMEVLTQAAASLRNAAQREKSKRWKASFERNARECDDEIYRIKRSIGEIE